MTRCVNHPGCLNHTRRPTDVFCPRCGVAGGWRGNPPAKPWTEEQQALLRKMAGSFPNITEEQEKRLKKLVKGKGKRDAAAVAVAIAANMGPNDDLDTIKRRIRFFRKVAIPASGFNLLGDSSKIRYGLKYGYLTKVMYLAPSTSSVLYGGVNRR